MSETLVPEELLTTREAARLLGVTPAGLRRMVTRGELRAVQIGRRGRLRYRREDLEALVRERNA